MPLPSFSIHRRTLGLMLFSVGIIATVVACGLLVTHTQSFSAKRDTAVMIGSTLPELKSSVALLNANIQAEQLFAAEGMAAREEQAVVYVLPQGPSTTRRVQAMQVLADALSRTPNAKIALTKLSFDPAPIDHGSYKTLAGHLTLTGNFQSVARFLAVLSYSGDMMIRDVLGDQASQALLERVEQVSPLSLKVSERFLYTDLIFYSANPDQVEQALLSDMPANAQTELRAFVLQAGLARVRTAFEGIAQSLHDKGVWPMPLVKVDGMVRTGDQWEVELVFYRR